MANSSIITRDVDKLSEPTQNLYKSLSIISKRARQIAATEKEELNS
jgi:DNA-directed RNA polymerase subunit K/omega